MLTSIFQLLFIDIRHQPRNPKYLQYAGPEFKGAWPVGSSGVTGIEAQEKPYKEKNSLGWEMGGDQIRCGHLNEP